MHSGYTAPGAAHRRSTKTRETSIFNGRPRQVPYVAPHSVIRYAHISQRGGGDPAINDFRVIVNYDFLACRETWIGTAERWAMTEEIHHEATTREPVLSPVDRVSEMLFGR